PPGVGACCTRECLLLQIDRLETRDAFHELMRCIVAEHWEDFVAHRFTSLARTMGIPYEQLLAVRDLIRRELQPYPLAEQDADARPGTLYPDVMITTEGDLFSVEVAEGRHYSLRLNPLYQQLSHAVRREEVAMSEADREHLHLHVARAQLFLRNLLQRRRTIHAIAAYVVEQQTAFLRQGIRHLQPLTRTEVGEALGLHDSTVSRATAHKYVLLPNREIIPFSTFFSASLSVKDVLKELINSEKRPLTDDEIADQLRHRGYALARRTVAKYRGQLGIPPAAVR
ncbi:MAG: RNA polymerase sigma-54 factor, partial [Oscillochloris sp.]|nr:RNA polymerase sigma-54 factor [Oscillochloris sp.]